MLSGTTTDDTWIDPISRFIDRQLSSVWRSHQLLKRQERNKWVASTKEHFSSKNRLEDEMIYAVDAKHFGSSRADELLMYYAAENCYTQADLGILLGRSQSWVSQRLHSLSAVLSGEMWIQQILSPVTLHVNTVVRSSMFVATVIQNTNGSGITAQKPVMFPVVLVQM